MAVINIEMNARNATGYDQLMPVSQVGLIGGAAPKSIGQVATATVAGWVGTAAPYTQVLTVEGVSATCNVEVGLASNATLAQIKDCGKALVWCTAQGTNQITLTAHNKKPTVDLPIQILIIG